MKIFCSTCTWLPREGEKGYQARLTHARSTASAIKTWQYFICSYPVFCFVLLTIIRCHSGEWPSKALFCWASWPVTYRWTIIKDTWRRLFVSEIIIEDQSTSRRRMFHCRFGALLFWTILCSGKAFTVRSGRLRQWTMRISSGFTFPAWRWKWIELAQLPIIANVSRKRPTD